MLESTCPHKWDFKTYGTCPMCLEDMQSRHSPNYITTEMLYRIENLSYTNDLPSRYVRMMASELLSLRQQIGQRQAELEFIMQKNMQAPKQEPAQSAEEPVGYISGWINGHLAIRLLDPALALSTGTALFLQPPTVPPAISEQAQAVPVAVVVTEPDYWSSGHFYKGSRPYIKNSDIAKLPIGTKLYTAPPAIDDETKRMVLELCELTLINAGPCGMVTAAMKQRAEQIRKKLEAGNGE